jgi:hypothetical protein
MQTSNSPIESALVLHPGTLPYYFNGKIPNHGFGPIGIDVEKIVLKPTANNSKCSNIAAEVSLVSGLPNYECFFHAFMYQNPKKVLSYNSWISGLDRRKLKFAPAFEFVRNQLKFILSRKLPLLVGCNLKDDLTSLNINHENNYDLQSFFYEFNESRSGFQPISLRRVVKKFYDTDIQFSKHDCITDARYSLKIYQEIFLDWKNVSKKFSLGNPPFSFGDFPKFKNQN